MKNLMQPVVRTVARILVLLLLYFVFIAPKSFASLVGPYPTNADPHTLFFFPMTEPPGSTIATNWGTKGGYAYAFTNTTTGSLTNPPPTPGFLGAPGYVPPGPFPSFGYCWSNSSFVLGNSAVGYDYANLGYFQSEISGGNASTEGTNEFLSMTNLNMGNGGQTPFTIEAMVNLFDTPSGYNSIINCDNNVGARNFWLTLGSSEVVFRTLSGSPLINLKAPYPTSGPNAFRTNQWYHVAVTYDGTNLRVYWTAMNVTNQYDNLIDTVATNVPNASFGLGYGPLVIGNDDYFGDSHAAFSFPGRIAQVRISDVCLASNQMMFAQTSGVWITQEPQNTIAAPGATATFSVGAFADYSPLTYQWFTNNGSVSGPIQNGPDGNGGVFYGATNSTLVISNLTSAYADFTYSCAITNSRPSPGPDFTNSVAATLTVQVHTPLNLVWRGTVNSTWDNTTATNWFDTVGLTNAYFTTGDNVTFDDTGAGNPVNIADAVAPGSVTDSATGTNYIFSGAGKITGATGLTKSGASTLTIQTANDYSGPTTISGGTLELSSGGTVGTGDVLNDGTLLFSGNNLISNNISGAGILTNAPGGTLTLSGSNSFTGNFYNGQIGLVGATLIISNSAALPANNIQVQLNGGSSPYSVLALAGGVSTPSNVTVAADPANGASYRAFIKCLPGSSNGCTINGPIIVNGDGTANNYFALFAATNAPLAALTNAPLVINGNVTGAPGAALAQFSPRGVYGHIIFNGTITLGPGAFFAVNDTAICMINSTGNSWGIAALAGAGGAGEFIIGTNNALAVNVPLESLGSGGVLDLNGWNQQIGGLLAGSSSMLITNTSATYGTLTYSNATGYFTNYGGAFSSGTYSNYIGKIAGNVSLNVAAGVLNLGGVNTYSGATTIANGATLTLTGSPIGNSTNITVARGATFDVTAAPFSLDAGQTLANSGSTAVVNGLNTGAGTVSLMYDGSTPPLTTTSGTLTLSSNTVFNINNTGPALGSGSYTIISSTGGAVGGFALPLATVAGNGTTGSGPVLLYINHGALDLAVGYYPPPEFTLQPAVTNFVLYAGHNHLMLTVAASASIAEPVSYQWFTNGVADTTAGTSPTYTGAPATATNFYCIASNVGGMATSEVVSVTYISPPTAPYPTNVLAANPIGYWRLNEPDCCGGSGPNNGAIAYDYLGGNNGIYTNTILGQPGYSPITDPTATAAVFGFLSSVDCDVYGIGGIDFGAPTNTSVAFTIEAWVNGYTQTKPGGIVSKGYGGAEQFGLDTGGNGSAYDYRFFLRDARGTLHVVNSSIAGTANASAWHHLVGVCDEANSNMTFYVDGVAVGQAKIAPGSGILASDRPMIIGSRPSGPATANDDQFTGFVQDVAVYNYALSASQVASQYFSAGIAPSFTLAPVQNTNASENGTLVVPATATGTPPLAYQWYNANTSLPLTGQTNATLVFNNVTTSDTYFELVVTNDFGSTNAYVYVSVITGAPQIQPYGQDVQNPFFAMEGGTGSNSVTAYGTEPFAYQWQFQTGGNWVNLTDGNGITGSRSNVLVIAAAQPAEAGNYQCAIANSSGAITSSVAQFIVGSLPIGLNINGAGWTPNQSGAYTTPVATNGVLTLTDGANSEARSFFFDYPQYIGAFKASWTYQDVTTNGADGTTFCIQNDPRGPSALGGNGGQLGVGMLTPITPSAELEMDIYNASGYAFHTNGVTGGYAAPGNVNFRGGDPINVTVYYANGQMAVTFADAVAHTSYATTLNVGDLTQMVGGDTAYIGFTGASGGSTAVQTISNFLFTSIPSADVHLHGTQALLTWPGVVKGYELQQNGDLSTTNWVNVTQAPILTNGVNQVTVPLGSTNLFYRLMLPSTP